MSASTSVQTGHVWDVDDYRGYANAMGRYKTETEMTFLRRHVRGERLRILDIGGGSGRFAIPLAEQGHLVTVVDISEKAVEMLRGRRHPNIESLCRDFVATEDATRFDAVIAIESVQYFTEVSLTELFTKVRRRLEPGAPFVFSGLNNRSWRYRLHSLRRSRLPYRVSDAAGYVTALAEAGLAVSEMRGFVWMPFPVSSNSRLVPVAAALERGLGLHKWLAQSPWILAAAHAPAATPKTYGVTGG